MTRLRIGITMFAAVLILRAESSWACATCFGAEGDPQTEGLNAAIITLLSVTYTLFFGMALTAFVYWKKNSGNIEDNTGELESPLSEEAPATHD